MRFSKRVTFWFLIPALLASACGGPDGKEESGAATVVFKHGRIAGDPAVFREILENFERENPGIRVVDEPLPASTDEQHQFFAINLEGKSPDFDVLSMDVIWVSEFARAGWLRDLSEALPPEEREGFFEGPMDAVSFQGKIYAIPWYIDAGLLYYRKDLLEKYGHSPPSTWEDLVTVARDITSREENLYGFVWQGKQYEGLVCNVLEYLWSNGGGILENGRVVADTPPNREALGFVKDLIGEPGVSPELVTTAMEEPTRHIFGNGKALFMRNWPYAWNIYDGEDSAIKGKVGVSVLPAFSGHRTASTLGGWQLGVNSFSENPAAALTLIRYLTSPPVMKRLALTVGYKPARKALYRDPDLLREQPFIAGLYEVFLNARPRPVSADYMAMTQIMQPEFSAAVTGMKTPEEALKAIQTGLEHIISRESPGRGIP